MKLGRIGLGIVIALIVIPVGLFATGTVFVVSEPNQAVITRFGEIQYAIVTGFEISSRFSEEKDPQIEYLRERYDDRLKEGAGLYWKIPFVDQVHMFESRILEWDGEIKEISTEDLRTLVIGSTARWRIKDPIRFYKAVGLEREARIRLGGVIVSRIEDEVSKTRLIEVVRSENLELGEDIQRRLEEMTTEQEEVEAVKNIRYGRAQMIERIFSRAEKALIERFGVELVDVMLTRLNYTKGVRDQVYQRMSAERKRIAADLRSKGEQRRREILGRAQKQKDKLISSAEEQVRTILGKAEADAIDTWSSAYTKNPEFFRFRRSLSTYRKGLKDNSTFLLTDDNDLFRYLTDRHGE